MIEQINLKNWKTHLDSKIAFSSGTNVIIGNVGTGKSSLMDAVCFALFGTFPVLQSKKIKLDDVLMRRPVNKDKAETEVIFTTNGKKYSVKRIVEKGKGTSYSEVREGAKLIETNASRVTEAVENILKTNYETFSKAIYSEQNNMDYFLTLGKGQRVKKIDELLLIDKFESARSACVSVRNRISDRKSAIHSVLDRTNIIDAEKRVSELKASVESIKADNISIANNLEGISAERSSLESELKDVSGVHERVEKLKKDKAVFENLLEDVQSTIKSLENELAGTAHIGPEQIQKVKGELSVMESRMKELVVKREDLLTILAENRSRKERLEEDVSDLSSDIEEKFSAKKELDALREAFGKDIEKEVETNIELLNKTIYEMESVRNRMNELSQSIEQLSQAESKCPVCESKLYDDMKDALVKTKKKDLELLSSSVPRLESERSSVESRLRELKSKQKTMEQLERRVDGLDKLRIQLEDKKHVLAATLENVDKHLKEIATIKTRTDSLTKELDNKRDDENSLRQLYLKFQTMNDNKKRESEIKTKLDECILKLHEEESLLNGKNIDALKIKLNGLVLKEAVHNKDIVSNKKMLEEKMLRLSELSEECENWKLLKEKTHQLDKIIVDLKIFDKAIEATQVELRRQFVEAVNHTMNQLWSTLYPYGDFTEIRMHIEEGDYVLKLMSKSGVWNNADGGVSGGERSIACLALRIAFSLVLAPNISVLLLDEPGHNLDSNAITQLAGVLRDRMGEFMEQVILITHQQELEEAVTGLAYRLERDKANDDVTRIVQLQ